MEELSSRDYKEKFERLVVSHSDKASRAGRFTHHENTDRMIFLDILSKLRFEDAQSFLDIGCGCSGLTDLMIEESAKRKMRSTLVDAPKVLEQLKKDHPHLKADFLEGYFPEPEVLAALEKNKKFDRILAYSVIQYADDPKIFLRKLLSLLNAEGRLLIGDLPNPSRWLRFILSEEGRMKEADFRGIRVEDLPVFESEEEAKKDLRFLKTKKIDDAFVLEMIKEARTCGFDAYIFEQPEELPYSWTREDLLFVKSSEKNDDDGI